MSSLSQLNRSLEAKKSLRICSQNETLLERKRLKGIEFLCDYINNNNDLCEAHASEADHRCSELSDLSLTELMAASREGSAEDSSDGCGPRDGSSCETLHALHMEEALVCAELSRLLDDSEETATTVDDEDEDLKEFRRIEREIKVSDLQKCLEALRRQMTERKRFPKLKQKVFSYFSLQRPTTAPLADSESMTTETDDRDDEQTTDGDDGRRQRRPLTLYLPVVDEELNLVQHIQTLGHELADKPEVSVTRFTCAGYLLKRCQKWDNKWRKRFFVFDRLNKVLVYYHRKRHFDKSRKPDGGVYFDEIHDVYVDHTRNADTRSVFIVAATSRQFVLSTHAPELMRIWVDCVVTGAQAYQDFGLEF